MHEGTLQNLGQVSRPIQSIQGGELTSYKWKINAIFDTSF